MRPNTSESGIFSTKRNSPVSTSMLTRMLVPKPNKRVPVARRPQCRLESRTVPAVPVMLVLIVMPPATAVLGISGESALQHRGRVGDPAEDAALGLDHLQAHLVEFGKVGGAAIRQHDAAIAAVVGLAHRGVDADLGGDAADQQILDAVFLQHVAEFGGVERALARLVDHDLAVERIQLGNDVVAGLAADQDAPHRAGIADAQASARRARPWPAARRTDRADGPRGCARPACRCRAPHPAPPRSASPRARAARHRCRAFRRSRRAPGNRAACR